MSLNFNISPTNTQALRLYGVYLLCSQSSEKRYNGKCYVGFTVNPMRRIQQHNRGKEFGGAKKTNNKGPWKMILLVHGFPNNIPALQFEWAWQQPSLSSRLKCYPELKRKLPKETHVAYNFRILSRLLNVGPWQRLPLVIQWLELDYICEFEKSFQPPSHMEIIIGSSKTIMSQKPSKVQSSPLSLNYSTECYICTKSITDIKYSFIRCLNNMCQMTYHITCLANYCLSLEENRSGHYVPIKGKCPFCQTLFLWTHLIQQKRYMLNTTTYHKENTTDSEDEQLLSDFDDFF